MKIKIQILQNYIHFSFTTRQFKKIQKKLSRQNIELTEMNGSGMSAEYREENGQPRYILAITKKNDMGLLAHEASHIVTYMMETYGFTDDEFRSYMLATIIYEAQNIIRNK